MIEAVKLVQSGLASDVDTLWFVTADEAARLRRLMSANRDGRITGPGANRGCLSGSFPRAYGSTSRSTIPVIWRATLRAVDDAWQAVSLGQEQRCGTTSWCHAKEEQLVTDRVTVDVYFDFACPYVHSAASWLREVNEQLGDERLEVNWKFFPWNR